MVMVGGEGGMEIQLLLNFCEGGFQTFRPQGFIDEAGQAARSIQAT